MIEIKDNPVASGAWGDDYNWELYESSLTPSAEFVTAVACVALAGDGVVLTRNYRGWEVLAGHIEPGESMEDALRRESYEEGGYEISTFRPIGYRKVTALKPPIPGSRESKYPYPTSYIAYFLGKTESRIEEPLGSEIIESRTFTIDEINRLAEAGEITEMEVTIIKLGLEAEVIVG